MLFTLATLQSCHGRRHMPYVTRQTSHVTRHTSHVTRHTSNVTRHTSNVTRLTSHVTGIRGFNKLHKSVSTIGLCGLDKLLSFMVSLPSLLHSHVLMPPSYRRLRWALSDASSDRGEAADLRQSPQA
jgi:hypothetical protein